MSTLITNFKEKVSNFNEKVDLDESLGMHKWHLERLNPWYLVAAGCVMLVLVVILLFSGGTRVEDNEAAMSRAGQTMGQVNEVIENIRRVLEDEQVQELAVMAAADPGKQANLRQYVSGRIPDLFEVKLFDADLTKLRAADLDPFGFAVLDLLFSAKERGLGRAQIHGKGARSYLAMAVRVDDDHSPAAYLLARLNPDVLVSTFNTALYEPGVFALSQYNGRFEATILSDFATPLESNERLTSLPIPSSLFRVDVKQTIAASSGGFVIEIPAVSTTCRAYGRPTAD
jgi:hypothetical protein